MSNRPVLELEGIYKRFDDPEWVIEDFSATVRQGEILYLLGPSGGGKTTLLRMICGFESPDRGEIILEGKAISGQGWMLPPERRRIGMVFQDYAIFPHLTVRGNVLFGVRPPLLQRVYDSAVARLTGSQPPIRPLEREEAEQRLEELLKLTGLAGLERRYPHELSGGQQQRVALARALASKPELILLDEPFSNLDTALRHRIRREVRDVLREAGATSIIVTHDQEEAINMADRVAVVNQGRLEQLGTPDELLHAPVSRFVATFIGMSDFIQGTVKDGIVETELGKFPLENGGTAPVSGRVDVLLRPDHITIAEGKEGVPARVLELNFMGIQTLYSLALPSGAVVEAFFPGHPHLKREDQVKIRFQAPKMVVFPAQ